MSKTILKQCLAIVEEDLPTNSASSQKTKQKPKKKQKSNTIFDLIPEQKRLTIKKKNCKGQTIDKVNKIKHTTKFTVKQAKERINQTKDRTEENVRRLLALDNTLKLDGETKELMLKRARTGHYVAPDKTVVEEEDIFTEEDFAKFEREYFFK